MFSQPTCSASSGDSVINLLITGCYRSGTTLLEKLLHNHENVCLASQPFPVLYLYVKLAFYKAIGVRRRYPLDHLYLENGYQPEEFYAFLDQFRMSSKNLNGMFDEMFVPYSKLKDASKVIGISHQTGKNIWKTYKTKGIGSIAEWGYRGRKARISYDQLIEGLK